RKCRDIPGSELFQYLDKDGNSHTVESGRVNAYIKDISGGNFSAKDFRTWTGSVQALIAFREMGNATNTGAVKRQINAVLDSVSRYLGNTRAVCRKYYVHPTILTLFE